MCSDKLTPSNNQPLSGGRSPILPTPDPGLDLSSEGFQGRIRPSIPLLPDHIAYLQGRVEKFDFKKKEIIELSLDQEIQEKLQTFFGTSSLDSVRRISSDRIESLLNDVSNTDRLRLSQLAVIAEVPMANIPDSRVDPKGILSMMDRVMTLSSATVFFSSPDLNPDHHNKLLSYVLSWPDRVNLRRDLLIDRINSGREVSATAEWNAFRKVDYERISFKDLADNEWSAHIVFSSPHYGDENCIDRPMQEVDRYRETLEIAGLNPKHPFKVLNKPNQIAKFLEGKEKLSGQIFDIIDLTALKSEAKQALFKSPEGLKNLLSVLSERGAILSEFNNRLEIGIKESAEGHFRRIIAEQAKQSAAELASAKERLARNWDSQPYAWLRQLEHRVLSQGNSRDTHLLISKEVKVSALPEILVDASQEFKAELVLRYKNGREFERLAESPRRATAKQVMNFVLDELLKVYAGELNRLTPISKLSEMFSIESKAITYYHDILLREDVHVLIMQERKKSARLTRDSVVAEVAQEVEAYVKGEIESFSNEQLFRDKYSLHGGQFQKYLDEGLSKWANRYRHESLTLVPSRHSAIRNKLHRSIVEYIRDELRQYHETGEPVSVLADLSKKFQRSPSKINRVIHLYLSSDEQSARMLATRSDGNKKPKAKGIERMARAIDSVKSEIEQLRAGSLEHITLLSHRASRFKVCEIRLRDAIQENLNKVDYAFYVDATTNARRELKAQLIKQNRASPKKK